MRKLHDRLFNCSFHPTLPVLATSSGQRKFIEEYSESSDDDNETQHKHKKASIKINRENSLKFWHLNKPSEI
jgi:hypothetical protein